MTQFFAIFNSLSVNYGKYAIINAHNRDGAIYTAIELYKYDFERLLREKPEGEKLDEINEIENNSLLAELVKKLYAI